MLRLSKGKRASGTIKAKAEDFKVEEITTNGTVLEIGKSYSPNILGMEELQEGKFSIFVMQKRDWNTAQAIKTVARRFRRGIKSTSFAGTKDRTSISTQLCSIYQVKPEELARLHIKDISINGAWIGSEKVKMGDLLGNRFIATITDASGCESINGNISELGGIFPNYYGEQRFGSRGTNLEVGVDILKGDFKSAAMRFLTDTSNERNYDATSARERLKEELDFKAALSYFPDYLKYERLVIEYLSKYPENYANALRMLPRSISLMFVHSVEAHIFNKELEERISSSEISPRVGDIVCNADFYGFPDISSAKEFDGDLGKNIFIVGNIIGHDTKNVTELEKSLLEDLGLTLESFKSKGLNELNSKGTSRVLFAPFKDISSKYEQDKHVCELNFSLPAGSYATVLLEELIEKSADS